MRTWCLVLVLCGLVARMGQSQELPVVASHFPYESQYVDVLGSRMHYVEQGAGDPILFLHGNPDHVYVWRNLIPYAAQVGRAVAVDLIGMGKSEVPDIGYEISDHVAYVEGFIEALGLTNITLVVHDWGSVIGLDYARRHPENVRGVVLMEAILAPLPNWEAFPESARSFFQAIRMPNVGRDLIVVQNAFGDGPRLVRTITEEERELFVQPLKEEKRREVAYRFARSVPVAGDPQVVDHLIRAYQAWLPTSSIPMLMVYATPGVISNQEQQAWHQALIPNLDVFHSGPGFHYPMEENPHGIGKAMVAWLQQHAP